MSRELDAKINELVDAIARVASYAAHSGGYLGQSNSELLADAIRAVVSEAIIDARMDEE